MGKVERTRLEDELGRHYASQRESVAPEVTDALVSAMVAEDISMRDASPHGMGPFAFVASQVRYVPVWTWAAHAALVALMCVLARAAGNADSTRVSVGILSAMCVLVGVPTVHSSKLHRVAELEYACVHDAASVMVARLIVLGCSSALAVALMVAAAASAVEASAFDVALWACPPFFLSCAGSLMALRKVHPLTATMLCVAWTAACCIALLALANVSPDLYADTSIVSWALAAAAALAWLVREVTLTLRSAADGFDAFSPQFARTYN